MRRRRRKASGLPAMRRSLQRWLEGKWPHRKTDRRGRFETLEDRRVLAAAWNVPLERFDPTDFPPKPYFDPSVEVLYAPGTSEAYIDAIGSEEESPVAPFTLASRWTNTATDGFGLSNGDPTTLTWSIADDGTPISDLGGINGESTDPSDLVAYLGGIYGVTTPNDDYTDEPWFPLFQSVFDRWSELTGITYVYEPNDDAAAFSGFSTQAPGVLGTRGDVRIGGHRIDGGSGVLAYNFYPNNGEMVFDTADNFFTNLGGNSLRLRNVLAHEAGHGIGIRHSVSSDAQFLMEPFASTAFDGPQFDDILGAQKLYGDFNGDNDSVANATSLGSLGLGESVTVGAGVSGTAVDPSEVDFVSIDRAGEQDFYSFDFATAATIQLTLTPVGPTYQVGAQGGTQSTFDSQQQSDLFVELRDSAGNLLVTADAAGLGGTETINFSLSDPGAYVAVVSGSTAGAIQMYELQVAAEPAGQLMPFERLEPLGGLITSSGSNVGNLASSTAEQSFDVYLQAGETIAAVASPTAGTSLSLEVLGLTGVQTSAAAGQPVLLPATAIPADGSYTVRLSADAATNFELTLIRNAVIGDLLSDTSDGSELPIDRSLIELGSGRYGALGNSLTGGSAAYEFVQSSDPSGFIDISATGASVQLGNEQQFNFTTSIGNEIFPAGTISINSNGGIAAGGGVLIGPANESLPSEGFGAALLPFWDDLSTGQVYWQESVVNGINALIVQWDDRPHDALNSGAITFQLQLFESGPTLARFAYRDVVFGTQGRNTPYNKGASATVGFQTDASSGLNFSVNSASLSNDDVIDVVKLPPDGDEYTIDLTGKAGQLIDIVLAGQGGVDFSGQTLELIDVDGSTVLASGVPNPVSPSTNATNFDLAIFDAIIPADGVYTVRVASDLSNASYGLVVTESLQFDAEPNDQAGQPLRAFTPSRTALGHLGSDSDVHDDYAIDLTLNQFVSFATSTVFDDALSQPTATLDPELEILHPDGTTIVAADANSAADGKNALVSFFAPVAGTYTVRVRSTSGVGDYLLSDGAVEVPPPTDVFLNEVVENPGGAAATDNPNEYLELRGPAGRTLSGVYLVMIDGEEGATQGAIGTEAWELIDLSAFSIGSSGYLVIVDDANDPYTIAPGTTVVDVPGMDLTSASYTAMLIHVDSSGVPPIGGQDLDVDDNGLDSLPSGWTVVDDLSVLDGGVLDRGYGQIVFSPNANGLTEGAAGFINAGSEFDIGTLHHLLRIGDSTGSTAADWAAVRHQETPPPTAPDFVSQASTHPAFLPGFVTTYHLGESNPTATDTLSVTVATGSVSEAAGASATTVTITRSSGDANPLTVTLTSDDPGEAIVPVTATILAGQSSVVVDLDAVDELVVDGTKTVTITATAVAHQDGSATIDVTDNDSAAITISDLSVTEGGTFLFTVALDNEVQDPFSVDVSYSGGNATAGVDYDNAPVTLNFTGNAGESQQFSITTSDDEVFEGDETFVISLDASNVLVGDSDTATATILENDPQPPGVQSVVFDDGSGQRSVIRSITVTFDMEVTVDSGAFVVNSGDGTEVPVSTSLALVAGKTQATLAFSGPLTDATGSLVDGNYRLTIIDAKITNAGGLTLDGDGDGVPGTSRVDDFFRLFGDADGNREVNLIDYSEFRAGFGQVLPSPDYRQEFDHDADGDVDLDDFAAFRSNFGAILNP